MTGEEIRTRRQQAGLSQVELARLLDVDVGTVSRWERGAMQPRPYVEHAVLYVLRKYTK